jgi:hypothetical protein
MRLRISTLGTLGVRVGSSARRYGGDAALRSSPPPRSQMAPLASPGRSPLHGFIGEGEEGWLAPGACSQRAPRPSNLNIGAAWVRKVGGSDGDASGASRSYAHDSHGGRPYAH